MNGSQTACEGGSLHYRLMDIFGALYEAEAAVAAIHDRDYHDTRGRFHRVGDNPNCHLIMRDREPETGRRAS